MSNKRDLDNVNERSKRPCPFLFFVFVVGGCCQVQQLIRTSFTEYERVSRTSTRGGWEVEVHSIFRVSS